MFDSGINEFERIKYVDVLRISTPKELLKVEQNRNAKLLYLYVEKEFLQFERDVPLKYNKNLRTVSPKMHSILLNSCGQIESVTKRIYKKIYDKKPPNRFAECYKELSETGIMEPQSVFVPELKRSLYPFDISKPLPPDDESKPLPPDDESKSPLWWKTYNHIKHDLLNKIQNADMAITIHALAALYLLLNMEVDIPKKDPQKILHKESWRFKTDPYQALLLESSNTRIIRSALFIRTS